MKHAVRLFGGSIAYTRTAIIEAASVSTLCKTARLQLHILIKKLVLSPKNAMKFQKNRIMMF